MTGNVLVRAIEPALITKCVAFCISSEGHDQSLFPLELGTSFALAGDAELWALEVYDEGELLCRVDWCGNVEFLRPNCEARVVQLLIWGMSCSR